MFKAKPKSIKTYEKMNDRALLNHLVYWRERAAYMGDPLMIQWGKVENRPRKVNKHGVRVAHREIAKIEKIRHMR